MPASHLLLCATSIFIMQLLCAWAHDVIVISNEYACLGKVNLHTDTYSYAPTYSLLHGCSHHTALSAHPLLTVILIPRIPTAC